MSERDALTRALIEEYADLLVLRGIWRRTPGQDLAGARLYEQGVRAALVRVAERSDMPDLHERAMEHLAAVRQGTHG